MKDEEKTKSQLISELADLREQIACLNKLPTNAAELVASGAAAETPWRSLVANTPLFVLILDRDCRIRFINHTDSGTSPDQILGRALCDFCRPEDRQMVLDCCERVLLTGEPGSCEGPGMRVDNQEHWYVSHFGPIFDNGEVVAVSVISVNATDRKQAEQALRASEERFRKVFDEGPVGIALVGLDAQINDVNQRFCEMLGYANDEITALGLQGITHPDDWEKDRSVGARLRGGEISSYAIEKRYLRKDGRTIWGQLTASLIRDAQDNPTIIGIVEDITERKSAEEILNKYREELERRVQERTAEITKASQELQREIEERKRVQDELQAIYDNMVDGLLIGECSTGRLLRTNPSMCRMLGYSEEELLALSVAEIHPPESVPAILEKFRTQQEGHRIVTQNRPVLRKDGSVFYADIGNVRVSYHGNPCVIGIFRDISQRKEAEEALQEAHDELRAVYEGLRDGVLIADSETHRFIQTNGAMCKMLGYSEEEILLLSVEEIHPDENVPDVLDKFRLNTEGLLRIAEDTPVLRRDGTVFYADIATNRLTYRGRPCVIGFFRDVTERHKAQEALRRERRTLTHMLRASDHERQLIAYDIHDGLAQQLAGAIMQFQIYDQFKDSNPTEARKAYDGGVTLLRQGHSETRRLISGVRPPILDESGVMAAISHLIHDPAFQEGPSIEFRSRVEFSRLAPVVENVVYRIVQEGLGNARRHSGSSRVVVSLIQRDTRLRIEIRDCRSRTPF